MPTTKPRMMITLEPSTYAAITRLAKLQRRPAATVCAEFVTECAPILNEVSASLELAMSAEKDGPSRAVARITALLDGTMKKGRALRKEYRTNPDTDWLL